MMRKTSILFLGSQMTTGGAQRLLLQLAGWFHAQDIPVTVAFLYDKDGLHAAWQRQFPFPVINLRSRQTGVGAFKNIFHLAGGMLRLIRLMRRGRFSAVMTFTHHANLLGIPAAWLAGVPTRVASHHGRIFAFPKALERLHASMVNSRLTTCLTAISESVQRDAVEEGIRAEKIVVVLSGVTIPRVDPSSRTRLRQESGVAEDAPLVFSAGRLEPEKGHRYLLQAVSRLAGRYPYMKLVLAGGGSLLPALEEEAAHLNIQDRVVFLGVRQDVPEWMAAADVFALPSVWEGLGLVVLEAMAAGLPVVATQVGGVGELVEPGRNGLLVPPKDPAALADGIAWMLEHPAERCAMTNAGQRMVMEKYTIERMCAGYASVLDPAGTSKR